MSHSPSPPEPEHTGPRHRRAPTGAERAKRLLPLLGVVIVVGAVLFAVLHHKGSNGNLADATSTTATTSTTAPATSTTTPTHRATTTTVAPSTSSTTSTTTTTTVATPTTVPASEVLVEVVNGNGTPDIAATAGASLHALGFEINGSEDASNFNYTTSIIEYPPGSLASADTVLAHINGPTEVVESASVPSGEVQLILGSTFTGVAS